MAISRRISIAYLWFFKSKHNITLAELCLFFFKPRARTIASYYINNVTREDNFIKVSFKNMPESLFWPYQMNFNRFYEICAETFDVNDWHRYEKVHTRVENNDVVVDAGAAEGLFSLSIVNRCKKIFVIEPSGLFYESLKKTFHRYIPEKVELLNCAIGDIDSDVEIKDDGISSTIIESKKGTIKMSTLDSLLLGKGKISYIKADVEGFEMSLLKGATNIIKSYKPKISIACYHTANDCQAMISFLRQLVPEYKYSLRGVVQFSGKPVMAHFYI